MQLLEGPVISGSLSSLWLASFGLSDFGACPLFLFLSLSWVLSFYRVWQVSSSSRESNQAPRFQSIKFQRLILHVKITQNE